MTFFVNDKPYRSAAAAFRDHAEVLAEKSGIAISDEPYTKASFQLANGKHICYDKNSDTIINLFQEAGMNAHKEDTVVIDGEVDPNDITKVSRPIPSANKRIITEEAQTSEFVGEYAGDLNNYQIHHIIPFSKRDELDEGYIHDPNNLVAVNSLYHNILHHGTRQQAVKLLLDIFEAYPDKARFIKAQGKDAIDVAELSLSTHK